MLHIFTAARPYLDFEFVTTPEEDTAALLAKLNLKNDGKISKKDFLNALANDPDYSKYFKKLKFLNGSFGIGSFYLQEPGFLDNKKRFDIL